MTQNEVLNVARELKTWVGGQLQDVVIDGIKGSDPRSLRLGFYVAGQVRWLVFDYRIQAPLLVLIDGQNGLPKTPPKTAGKVRRPIELFLRSKHVGRKLRDVRVRLDEGRAIDLIFEEQDETSEIQLKVYPHGRNVFAVSGTQAVSEFKPLPIVKAEVMKGSVERPTRTNLELALEWLESVAVSAGRAPGADPRSPVAPTAKSQKSPAQIKLQKAMKAVEKVEAEILAKSKSSLRLIGQWLKENQTLDLPKDWPKEWLGEIDPKRTLSENIQKIFERAKSQERKILGTKARALELREEIAKLEQKVARGELGTGDWSGSAPKDLFVTAQARGRKFQLAADLIVYLGKNAAENLAILRKAQPFDYWLHLRDRPGAHAILRRARGRKVTDKELTEAGIYVAEQTMKRRAIDLLGESFDLLIVECRYVKPIKGDKLGRVHYTNDRVLRFKIGPEK